MKLRANDTNHHDSASFDLVANATPIGMKQSAPLPVRPEGLQPGIFVRDAIAVPALIAPARERGCSMMTGTGMFVKVCDPMVDFFMENKIS